MSIERSPKEIRGTPRTANGLSTALSTGVVDFYGKTSVWLVIGVRLSCEVSSIRPGHHLVQTGAVGAVAVDGMASIGEAERDAADHPSVVRNTKMGADERRIAGEGALCHRGDAERLRRQHEVGDIPAAVDRSVNVERLVSRDDRDVGRPEQSEILQRLFFGSLAVPLQDAKLPVELEAAFLAALSVSPTI